MKFQFNILNMMNVICKIHIAYFWVYNLDSTTVIAKIKEMMGHYSIPCYITMGYEKWCTPLPFAQCEEISGFEIHNHITYSSIFLAVIICPLTFPMGGNFVKFCSKPFAFIKCAIQLFRFISRWKKMIYTVNPIVNYVFDLALTLFISY